MTGKWQLILCLGTLAMGCAAQRTDEARGVPALRPSEVVRSAEALAGQEVNVRGLLGYGSHARVLWDSNTEVARFEAGEVDAINSCLTLIHTRPHHRFLTRRSGRTVMLRGRVRLNVMDGYIDYGACNDVGLELLPPLSR